MPGCHLAYNNDSLLDCSCTFISSNIDRCDLNQFPLKELQIVLQQLNTECWITPENVLRHEHSSLNLTDSAWTRILQPYLLPDCQWV